MNDFNSFFKKLWDCIEHIVSMVAGIVGILCFFGIDYSKVKPFIYNFFKTIIYKNRKFKLLLTKYFSYIIEIIKNIPNLLRISHIYIYRYIFCGLVSIILFFSYNVICDNYAKPAIFQQEIEGDVIEHSDKIIENYILRSINEIISINEFNNLTDDQLHYVRNGIYAYAGLYFKSEYYNDFSWYTGDVAIEEIYEKLNYYQIKNISRIVSIEKQRSLMNC